MLKIAAFSVKEIEQQYFNEAAEQYEVDFVIKDNEILTLEKAKALPSKGLDAVLVLPHRRTTADILTVLAEKGIKIIGTRSAGVDAIDVDAATRLGLKVVNVPSYSPQAIAEVAIFFMIGALRRMKEIVEKTYTGDLKQGKVVGTQLNERTVGIIGYGHIGQVVAKLLQPFGPKIIIYTHKTTTPKLLGKNIEYETDIKAFFRRVDIITLHCPLTPETEYLINEEHLQLMPKGSIIINTARGKIVETEAMLNELDNGHIAFYATDVYEHEGRVFHHQFQTLNEIEDELFKRLIQHPHTIVTPHIAFNTHTSIENMVKYCVRDTIEALKE